MSSDKPVGYCEFKMIKDDGQMMYLKIPDAEYMHHAEISRYYYDFLSACGWILGDIITIPRYMAKKEPVHIESAFGRIYEIKCVESERDAVHSERG